MSSNLNDNVLIKVGPRGDTGNQEWNESCRGNVRQIFICHGDAINSIQLLYDSKGDLELAEKHGGDGDNFVSIKFKSSEYLTFVSGYYGSTNPYADGPVVVRSLTFGSNRAIYGPYGKKQGTAFRFDLQTGIKFAGFHGYCTDTHLTAIGVCVKTTAKRYFKPDPPRCHETPHLCSASPEQH